MRIVIKIGTFHHYSTPTGRPSTFGRWRPVRYSAISRTRARSDPLVSSRHRHGRGQAAPRQSRWTPTAGGSRCRASASFLSVILYDSCFGIPLPHRRADPADGGRSTPGKRHEKLREHIQRSRWSWTRSRSSRERHRLRARIPASATTHASAIAATLLLPSAGRDLAGPASRTSIAFIPLTRTKN